MLTRYNLTVTVVFIYFREKGMEHTSVVMTEGFDPPTGLNLSKTQQWLHDQRAGLLSPRLVGDFIK